LSVLFQLVGVLVLKGKYFVLILLLGIFELLVPMFVELLVLFDVGLFTLFTLLLVHEDHLLHLTGVLLFFQLGDSVFCHFSLNVAALLLAGTSMVLHSGTVNELDTGSAVDLHELLNVFGVDFVILTSVLLGIWALTHLTNYKIKI